MNAQTLKLFLQACRYADHEHQNVPKEVVEKFAELIVKECADAIAKDSRLNDVRSAANGCASVIKEHFGVE